MLCVEATVCTLSVRLYGAERHGMHDHAERGNDQRRIINLLMVPMLRVGTKIWTRSVHL
jgi:hypothetical protein